MEVMQIADVNIWRPRLSNFCKYIYIEEILRRQSYSNCNQKTPIMGYFYKKRKDGVRIER